jgi:hypothetical protein
VTEHKPSHKFLHEAKQHTQTAQDIIHELLDGPDPVIRPSSQKRPRP